MLKAVIAIVLLSALGTFTYFFVTDRSDAPADEKAQRAVVKAKEAAVEEGVALGVRTRLTASLGFDSANYLHVDNRGDGRIWVYGMLKPGITEEQVLAEASRAPGVKDVKVMVMQWPEEAALPETPDGGTHELDKP
jgi:hypothetical protein